MVWNPKERRDECFHCGSATHDTAGCDVPRGSSGPFNVDDALRDRMLALAKRIQAQMPPWIGSMFCFYTRGEHLDLNMCYDEEPAEALRILRVAMARLSREDGGADPANEAWYGAPPGVAPSDNVVSSGAVVRQGDHDRVRLWNRGGLAGELMLAAGDGARLMAGFGLERCP